jgi:hypothetical protein
MTEDRIKLAQLNIQQNLGTRPEYVLNTSEFIDVKARLDRFENRRKPLESDSGSLHYAAVPGREHRWTAIRTVRLLSRTRVSVRR